MLLGVLILPLYFPSELEGSQVVVLEELACIQDFVTGLLYSCCKNFHVKYTVLHCLVLEMLDFCLHIKVGSLDRNSLRDPLEIQKFHVIGRFPS